jgi:hypothetical protein
MNPQSSLWLAVAYIVVIVGLAIRSWGRTLRLCLVVAFLTAIGISAWFMIGKLR